MKTCRCRYTYFKESGKYYSSGVGLVADDEKFWDFNRAAAVQLNGGTMPGLSGDGSDFFVVIEPDEAESTFSYPKLWMPG